MRYSSRQAPATGGATKLSELTDCTIATPANFQFLMYDGTTNKWINTPLRLDTGQVEDVLIDTASNNQSLNFDSDIEFWTNRDIMSLQSQFGTSSVLSGSGSWDQIGSLGFKNSFVLLTATHSSNLATNIAARSIGQNSVGAVTLAKNAFISFLLMANDDGLVEVQSNNTTDPITFLFTGFGPGLT